MKVKLELPQHSEPVHSVAVYAGCRYQFEVQAERKVAVLDLDVPDHDDIRFIHAAVQSNGVLQNPEYRAVCRPDGKWFPYKIVDAEWFGLPPLEVTNPCRKEPTLEVEQKEAACQLDDCECTE